MKIYWVSRSPGSDMLNAINEDGAQRWEVTEPRSDIWIGKTQIFIRPTEYDVAGHSLDIRDLEELLQKLRK